MRSARASTCFFCSLATLTLLFAIMTAHASMRRASETAGLNRMVEMVGAARLTDLCLFTEASYTRHPSQTDLRTPFQDHPFSLEHFPSGSLLPPPLRGK
jgi:hypothetical protein